MINYPVKWEEVKRFSPCIKVALNETYKTEY